MASTHHYGSLDLQQLSTAANEIAGAVATGTWQPLSPAPPSSSGANPNAMSTSTPSTFLSPSVASSTSSVVTSVSRVKRKVSAVTSIADSEGSSRKRTRPLTAQAQAQQAGGEAMQEMAVVVKNLVCSVAPAPSVNDPFGDAIDILSQHSEVTPQQRVNIGEYLALEKNRNQVILFRRFGEAERKEWLMHRLAEIAAAHQANMGIDQL
ncbi:hypothetical protein PAXRUDRAFT_21865 [Paxillus rubicundulus Ve08.2h10]|uniref:Uncharacterized protein n=1 Tax=Paxillus rubicundulus Ve08.2h10 TaxID=930991 RepID=A0A0D0CAF7_9AGAM|nr:hypothetical protein PAXRUDRAFT_21865 [Paxillus rubicundulus Ve08.2h10]